MRFIEIASSAGLPGESSGNSLRVMGSSAWLSDRVRPLCTATSITPDQRQSPPGQPQQERDCLAAAGEKRLGEVGQVPLKQRTDQGKAHHSRKQN